MPISPAATHTTGDLSPLLAVLAQLESSITELRARKPHLGGYPPEEQIVIPTA